MPRNPGEPPFVTFWEGVLMSLVPLLIVVVLLMEHYQLNAYLIGLVFTLIPISFGVALVPADQVRNRWLRRRQSRQ